MTIKFTETFCLAEYGDEDGLTLLEHGLSQSDAFFHKKAGLRLGKRVEILHLRLNSQGYGTLRPLVKEEEVPLMTKEELLHGTGN